MHACIHSSEIIINTLKCGLISVSLEGMLGNVETKGVGGKKSPNNLISAVLLIFK